MLNKPLFQEPVFSRSRTFFWPIQNTELKKFLPLGLMMFLIISNYTFLRNMQDTLVVTAEGSGAEIITFIKVLVLPLSVLFFFVYAKLSNFLSRSALFYSCIIPFLVFFVVFALFIYPNGAYLHLDLGVTESLKASYPHFKWFIILYSIWSYVLFYIVAEFWGVIVMALLFWQFANEITRIEEAKRFYPLFPILGNFALVLIGLLGECLSIVSRDVPVGGDPFGLLINYTLTTVVLSGIGIILIYAFMDKYVLIDPLYYDTANKKNKNNHLKLSIKESISYIFSSKYLGFIAILLVSYGITSNFLDIAWRGQVHAYFPHPNDYCEFMYRSSFWTGITTIFCGFMIKGIIRRFGWFTGAIMTPSILLASGLCFYSFILFSESLKGISSFLGVTSLYMAVVIGTVQNVFNKTAKHSLFDPTKEMAYIPLDQEMKVKGKAAIDVIGGRCGKASGGFIQTFLLIMTAGNLMTMTPYLLGIFVVVILVWMGAVGGLSKLYTAKVAKPPERDPVLDSQFWAIAEKEPSCSKP